ncbi:MAG: hypothetical protein ACLFSL_04230 [Candidatus Woesearchaeota archaeon]
MVFKQERFTNDFGEIADTILDESLEYMVDHSLYLFIPATYADASNRDVSDNIFSVVKDIQEKGSPIDNVVLGLDAAPQKRMFDEVKERFSEIPNSKVIWNDSPELKELYGEFQELDFPVFPGKGRNMWTALGHRYMEDRNSSFVIHDCDIKPQYYNEKTLLRLIAPILHPAFGEQDFSKAYYTRITPTDDGRFKLGGRATRMLVYPFLDAVKENYGNISKSILDYVDHLKSFKYPLSGEFAMRSNIANSLSVQPDWGLEIGTLNSLFMTRYRLAQVDLGFYDHKHSSISKDDPKTGLNKMAEEIVKTVFRKLYSLEENEVAGTKLFKQMHYDYEKFSSGILQKYKVLSASKDWFYDEVAETEAKKTFSDSIKRAYGRFTEQPEEVQPLPNWNQISHELRERLRDNVEKYN